MNRVWVVMLQMILVAGILALSGCNLLGTFGGGDGSGALVATAPSGRASVGFSLVVPGQGSGDTSPSILAEVGATPQVTFRLFIHDRTTGTVNQVTKTVSVANGAAEAAFDSLPAGTIVAEAQITGGTVSGYSHFHGAADLLDGSNNATLAPKGSGHPVDLVAWVVARLLGDSSLRAASPLNLATTVDGVRGTLASDTFTELYSRLLSAVVDGKLTGLTLSRISGVSGSDSITTPAGSRTASQMFAGTSRAGTPFLFQSVLRLGFGNAAPLALWRTADGSVSALTRIDASTGALAKALFFAGKLTTAECLPGGGVFGAGAIAGVPVVFRWDETSTGELTAASDGTAAWVQRFPGVFTAAGTLVPTAGYVEYLEVPERRLLCAVQDPASRLPRLFVLNPDTGAVVTAFTPVNKLPLWAVPGDRSIEVGWELLPGSITYTLYWSDQATLSPTSFLGQATNARPPYSHAGAGLSSPTFYLVTWLAEDGASGSSAVLRSTPLPPPTFVASFTLDPKTLQLVGTLSAAVTVTGAGSGTLLLSAPANSGIVSGSILLGGVASFPQKVIDAVQVGNALQLKTVNANLTEVFENASFTYEGPLSQVTQTTAASYRAAGFKAPLPASILASVYQSEKAVEAVDLNPDAPDPAVTVKLDRLKMRFDPRVKLQYEISWHTLHYFNYEVTGRVTTDLAVSAAVEKEYKLPPYEKTLLKWGAPLMIGPVPGSIEIDIPFAFTMSAKGKGSLTLDRIDNFDIAAGCRYWENEGWTTTKKSMSHTGAGTFTPKLEGEFAEAATVKISTAVKAGGLAGPKLSLGAGLGVAATPSTDKFWLIPVELKLLATGELEGVVELWTYKLAKVVLPLFEKAKSLGSRTIDLNTPPTVVIQDGPASETENPIQPFTFMGYDTGFYPGVKHYYVGIDIDPPTIIASGNSYTAPTLPAGTHTFRLMALDQCEATSPTVLRTFHVSVYPKIISLSTTNATPGATVSINGVAFGSENTANKLWIGNTAVTWKSWADTLISFVVPTSMSSGGDVKLTIGGKDTNTVGLTVTRELLTKTEYYDVAQQNKRWVYTYYKNAVDPSIEVRHGTFTTYFDPNSSMFPGPANMVSAVYNYVDGLYDSYRKYYQQDGSFPAGPLWETFSKTATGSTTISYYRSGAQFKSVVIDGAGAKVEIEYYETGGPSAKREYNSAGTLVKVTTWNANGEVVYSGPP